jgi:hypothetical protein
MNAARDIDWRMRSVSLGFGQVAAGDDIIGGTEKPPGVRLAPDFSFAEAPGGERIAFTRSERRALAALAQNPNRLLTRDQILDALTGPGSDKSDRNVDFLINRLRRKLSDDARDPRYIATRYGEGYVWIGRVASIDHADAYLIVGPLQGLDNLAGGRGLAERFAADLHAALRLELPPEQRVVLVPDCPPATEFSDKMPALSAGLTFFDERGVVNCVATVREFRSGRLLAIRRVAVPPDRPAEAARSAAELAKLLLDGTWRMLATETEAGVPLPVLMHLASTQPDHEHGSLADSDRRLQKLKALHENRYMAAWKENEARLRGLLMASPDDATLKIMYATHIHSKYISFGHVLFQNGIDERDRDEEEIEALVLAALPHVQSQPEYVIMAAKLLHFLDRGYYGLARDLAEEAYSASVSAAGSLAIIGQLRAFAGETEAALRCLDQALNLVTRGSKAHLYTLTIKMQALRAVADFDRLADAKRELYSVSGAAMLFYEPMFANPDRLSIRAKAVVMMLSREKAAAILKMNNYVSARLFNDPEHRANAILTPLTLVVRRFGSPAVPDEVAAAHPGLLDRFA